MLNPFKKKEEGFSLDDYSLPSLSNSSQFDNSNKSFDPVSNLSDQELINQTPKFEENNFSQSSFSNMQNNNSNQNFSTESHSHDLTKAKLETIEAKVSLMDARMSSMEQKLELIYQMLSLEVSQDTKNKLKIDSMMQNIRNK